MTGKPLHCAECKVEMTATDLEFAVPTDAGPVHRECFEGPLPPGMAIDEDTAAELTRAELEAENERRAEVGDPPVDITSETIDDRLVQETVDPTRITRVGLRCAEGDHDLCRDAGCGCGCHRDVDDGLDRRDPEDERGLREAAEEEGHPIR